MRIVIVGCGKVGRTIAEQLNGEKHDITIIDTYASVITRLTDKLDVMGIEGDGSSMEILNEAGARNADLLIAVTDADELNLYICLVANSMGTKNTIARVRKPIYHKDLSDPLSKVRNSLGLSLMINPEMIAATEIHRLIRFPSAIEVDSFAGGKVELYTFKLLKDNPLIGNRVKDTSLLKGNIRISCIERDDEVIIPNGDFIPTIGDKISVICTPENAVKLFKKTNNSNTKAKNIMIIGGSRTAYYLAKLLESDHLNVKIIEKNEKRCAELSDLLSNAIIIKGDGMNQDLLKNERFDQMNCVVTLTDIDEENIMLSLYARQSTGAKCITKIDRLVFDSIVETLPLDSVIRPRELTAEAIVRYVRAVKNSQGSNVETLYKLNNGKAEALEFKVVTNNADLISKPLKDIKFIPNLNVVCITRRGKIIIPKGDDTIEKGDSVIIVTTHKGLQDLGDVLA